MDKDSRMVAVALGNSIASYLRGAGKDNSDANSGQSQQSSVLQPFGSMFGNHGNRP